jgi:hypothetical protein
MIYIAPQPHAARPTKVHAPGAVDRHAHLPAPLLLPLALHDTTILLLMLLVPTMGLQLQCACIEKIAGLEPSQASR